MRYNRSSSFIRPVLGLDKDRLLVFGCWYIQLHSHDKRLRLLSCLSVACLLCDLLLHVITGCFLLLAIFHEFQLVL